MDWQCKTASEVIKQLSTDKNHGLSSRQAQKNLEDYGANRLTQGKNKSIVKKLAEQLSDFMVLVLLAAAGISFFTARISGDNDYIDSIIILVIVIVNAVTGVIQESKAEKSIEELKKLSNPHAQVIRNGKTVTVSSDDVVTGDILLLNAGDYICADARLIDSHNLKVEESSLTGEAVPVEKDASALLSANSNLGDMKNMVFASGLITSGHGKACVVATGMNTQVGKIAKMLNEQEVPQTPLQKRLTQTGKILAIGAIAICVVIFILGVIQNTPPFDMFMISVSLAVAAIPEGLAAIVTIVLAIGVRRLADKRAIIRKLPAVEALGSANIICSDKTGTLTQNKMTVTAAVTYSGDVAMTSHSGGELLTLCSLCNNSVITDGNVVGEPTEAAFINALIKFGMSKSSIDSEYPRIKEFPFSSQRKRMTTVHRLSNGKYRIITKGAPDVLLPLCTFYRNGSSVSVITNDVKRRIENQNYSLASQALRVLAVAVKDVDYLSKDETAAESKLTFYGLLGMMDPPRPQAKDAVKQCISAGIKPVMITGDHVATAKAIAANLGIMKAGDKAITGAELDNTDDSELRKHIYDYSVFARVSPEHKVRIVKAFQSHGDIVAMTGDGVNDAPALKAADIGCAMGKSGTDVARSAADLILTDDNFSTIIEAVRQGRGVFDNIRKTIHFLLSCNIGEIMTVLTAFLMGSPTPLLPIQLLWINLVTDSLPALALGMEGVDKNIMKRKPISAKKSLFSGGMGRSILIEGGFIGAISILAYTIGRVFFDLGAEPIIGRTMTFAVLSISQLVHAFNLRSEKSVFKISIFSNMKMIYSFIICTFLQISVISIPFMSKIFKTAELNFTQWGIILLLSFSPLVISELEKLFESSFNSRQKKKRYLTVNKAFTSQR